MNNFGEFVAFLICMFALSALGLWAIWKGENRREKLPMSYEAVKAESQEDAIAKSVWREGDLARVVGLTASSNSKGTYSVFPEFERVDVGELDLYEKKGE